MSFIPEELENYIVDHSQDEPDLLKELNRETQLKFLMPEMISGHFQGRVLSMISKLIQPQHILEIGTYTGYSALCLAEGLTDNGKLHTIDQNEELTDIQQKYFNLSDYKSQIISHLGNALEIIPTLNNKFDLVFIDADKENYINYYKIIIDKINTGGIILSDNVLWYGKVIEPLNAIDNTTKAIIEYNSLLKNDDRVESVILPIRDGLSISRKK